MQGGGAGQRGFSHATFARENKERSAAWRRGNTRIHLDGGRQPAGWYGRGRLADLPSFFPEGLQGNLAADFVGAQRNPPERKPGQRSVEKEVSKLATLQAVFFGANRTMLSGSSLLTTMSPMGSIRRSASFTMATVRSEENTSELQ